LYEKAERKAVQLLLKSQQLMLKVQSLSSEESKLALTVAKVEEEANELKSRGEKYLDQSKELLNRSKDLAARVLALAVEREEMAKRAEKYLLKSEKWKKQGIEYAEKAITFAQQYYADHQELVDAGKQVGMLFANAGKKLMENRKQIVSAALKKGKELASKVAQIKLQDIFDLFKKLAHNGGIPKLDVKEGILSMLWLHLNSTSTRSILALEKLGIAVFPVDVIFAIFDRDHDDLLDFPDLILMFKSVIKGTPKSAFERTIHRSSPIYI